MGLDTLWDLHRPTRLGDGDGDGDGKRRLAIDAIQKEVVCVNGQNNGDEVSNEPRHPASFIRDQLRSQTTPAQPSKRGSEERDYVFGRLFGIMAVVRSGSLTIAGVPIEVGLQLLSIWEGYQPCQPIFVC